MKPKTCFFIVLIIIFTIISCKEIKKTPNNTSKEIATTTNYNKAAFTIKGMTCVMGCATTIEKELAKMDGVKTAKVDFKEELAMVEYNPESIALVDLALTVTNVGSGDVYTVENMNIVKDFDLKSSSKSSHECKKNSCSNKDNKKACCAKKI